MDANQFEERAAIMEFDGGLSRFNAETLAAREQGYERWQAIGEVARRIAGGIRDQREAARRNAADDMSELQRGEDEKNRPMPVRNVRA